MIAFVILLSYLLCAVNVPLLYFGTTKRLGLLLLLFASFYLFMIRARITFSQDFFWVASFWSLYMVSIICGVLKNGEVTTVAITAVSTFILIFLSGVCARPMRINRLRILSAIFLLNIFSLAPFVVDFYLKGYSVFFLRKYLIESSVSINSIFNQFYVLFCLNVLAVFLSRFHRSVCCLFLGLATFLFLLIIFSLSRQNLLACLVFLLSFFVLSIGWKKVIFYMLAVFALLLFMIPTVRDLEQATYLIARVERTESQVSGGQGYSRFKQFSDSFALGAENPMLGVGLGGFYEFAEEEGYAEHVRVPEAAINQIASEHGVVMLLLFLLVYFVMYLRSTGYQFVAGGRVRRECGSPWLSSFLLGHSVLLLFNEVHFQFSFWGVYLAFSGSLGKIEMEGSDKSLYKE